MVQLPRPAAARLSPVLARHGKAGDLMGKPGYGRKAIQVGAVLYCCVPTAVTDYTLTSRIKMFTSSRSFPSV